MKRYISLMLLVLLSCSQGEKSEEMNKTIDNTRIKASDIKKIASKRIYFGHQSVGYNLIEALKTIIPAESGLTIVETCNPEDFKNPIFAHSQNGENFKPETKIASFVQKINFGLGNKVDIAFFKFCYVDVNAHTDVNKLFSEYKSAMDQLIKKYPKTMFLHVTAPVTVENNSGIVNKVKYLVKTIIGKKTGEVSDNINRMKFNNLLRQEYGTDVFDLAAIESSDKSGKEILSDKGKTAHQMLLPQYTNDGGHLNNEGAKIAGLKFIDFIKNQIK